MRLKALARYVQHKLREEIGQDAVDEAVVATADAIAAARAEALRIGRDPDAMERQVEAVRPRNIEAEVPTMAWCRRIALKHVKNARAKVGGLNGLKEEVVARVRVDPDDVGKRPATPPGPPRGGPPG